MTSKATQPKDLRATMPFYRNPIILKESLTTSRRFRFYLLRLGYLAAMAGFVAIVWRFMEAQLRPVMLSSPGAAVASVAAIQSHMADMGKLIVVAIVWFQFIAAQMVAVLLMCNSFSSECQKRTVVGLLTTPLSYFDIAVGKTFGGIRQVLILLACSVPLLALLRIFGGVPLSFLVQAFIMTVGAVLLAGAVSFYFSIVFSQPYVAAFFALLIVSVTSIFTMMGMYYMTQDLLRPGGQFSGLHLSSSSVAFLLSVWFLRHGAKALRNTAHTKAWGDREEVYVQPVLTRADEFWLNHYGTAAPVVTPQNVNDAEYWNTPSDETLAVVEAEKAAAAALPELEPAYGQCEQYGSPIIWKDCRDRFIKSFLARFLLLIMPWYLGSVFYALTLMSGNFMRLEINAWFYCALLGLGGILTAGLSALTVASERAARTWPILQTTPLSDWHILRDKALGVFMRFWPLWLILVLHTLLFTFVRALPPAMLLIVPMQIVAVNVFAIAAGMLIGLRVRQVGVAILTAVGLTAFVWLLLPYTIDMATVAAGGGDYGLLLTTLLSPVLQNLELLQPQTPGFIPSFQGPIAATLSAGFYIAIGANLARMAMRRFRRHAFE
jgi:ABC-type transport system involved in multi-copper enzyme maturation permease subunit